MDDIFDIQKLLLTVPTPKVETVFSKKILSNTTHLKLFDYQRNHCLKLIKILLTYKIALDISDTGVGKTYTAIAVAKEMGRSVLIACPKTLMSSWKTVAKYFDVIVFDIVNYETLKNCKTYKTSKFKSRKNNSYLEISETTGEYVWDLPNNVVVIFDEVHRCKNIKSDVGKLLISLKQIITNNIPILLLSATICEKYTDMKTIFYLINLINNIRDFKKYLKTVKYKYPQYKVSKVVKTSSEKENNFALIISQEIKNYSSRIRIQDLGDKFPQNQWFAQQFFAKDSSEIAKAYKEIAILKKKLEENPGSNHLAKIQKLKQEIELRKVPIFIEQAKLYLENNKSVIIFVNYLDSFNLISNCLNIKCKIYGEQTIEQRLASIDDFQSNRERIIICQMRAGGVGISLHDKDGAFPRVALVNYTDSAADLLQALGRAPRAGAKSIVLQRIIFVANVTYEKKIMSNVNKKLANISAINDSDLHIFDYKIKKAISK